MALYEVLGTLAEEPGLTAQVVRLPHEEELLLCNRIPLDEKSRDLFRDMHRFNANRPERTEFQGLLVEGQNFCALFHYNQGPSLRERFAGGGGNPAWRLTVLYDVMLYVYNAAKDLPPPVLCSMLRPENILFDRNEVITLRWRLYPEYWEKSCNQWHAAAELIHFLAGKEVEDARYRTLHSIYKRCLAGLYDSMPALLHDLKTAGETLIEADPIRRLKAFFLEKKERLQKSANLGVLVLLFCLVVYVIVELSQAGPTGQSVPIMAIGNVTYVSAQEEDGGLRVNDPAQPPPETSPPVFTSLPSPDAELDSEDYVVQSGETLAEICTSWYGVEGYDVLAAAFNGLDAGKTVEAGTVLRMPRRDQLSQYLG